MKNYENPIFRDIEPDDYLVSDPHRILNNKNYSDDISDEQRTKNSIAWIDSLDPEEGFQKTTQQLGVKINGSDWENVSDHRKEGKYCCLGVACVGLGLLKEPFSKGLSVFGNGYDERLEDLLGLNYKGFLFDRKEEKSKVVDVFKGKALNNIMGINDVLYSHDHDFSNMRSFILENLSLLFKPEVSERLKKHYNK